VLFFLNHLVARGVAMGEAGVIDSLRRRPYWGRTATFCSHL